MDILHNLNHLTFYGSLQIVLSGAVVLKCAHYSHQTHPKNDDRNSLFSGQSWKRELPSNKSFFLKCTLRGEELWLHHEMSLWSCKEEILRAVLLFCCFFYYFDRNILNALGAIELHDAHCVYVMQKMPLMLVCNCTVSFFTLFDCKKMNKLNYKLLSYLPVVSTASITVISTVIAQVLMW